MVVDLKRYRHTKNVRKAIIQVTLGERVMIARKNQGKTQEDLGLAVGYSQGVISRWESGQIDIDADDISRIAQALSCPGLLDEYCAQCPVALAHQKLHREPKGVA